MQERQERKITCPPLVSVLPLVLATNCQFCTSSYRIKKGGHANFTLQLVAVCVKWGEIKVAKKRGQGKKGSDRFVVLSTLSDRIKQL